MEAKATYTAARPVVTVPAWRASAEKPDFLAGAEGRFTRGKVKAPGRPYPSLIQGINGITADPGLICDGRARPTAYKAGAWCLWGLQGYGNVPPSAARGGKIGDEGWC